MKDPAGTTFSTSYTNLRKPNSSAYFNPSEKVIASLLLKHRKESDLLGNVQSAYKQRTQHRTAFREYRMTFSHRSTTKKGSFLVLLDQSTAFDTVH